LVKFGQKVALEIWSCSAVLAQTAQATNITKRCFAQPKSGQNWGQI